MSVDRDLTWAGLIALCLSYTAVGVAIGWAVWG